MPLRDHFHRPGRGPWPWTSVHGQWAATITQQLNQKPLPPGYVALPHVHLGGQGQVDVATLQDEEEEAAYVSSNGGVATATWAPPKPALVVATDLADVDTIEIEVVNEEDGYRLVAAVELVSPANKDRSGHRHAFVSKCAAYLQKDVSVVVVDVVTERLDNLHAELSDFLYFGEAVKKAVSSNLYAVAYRAVKKENGTPRVEIWPSALRVGEPLPTLPLWLGHTLAVPLDLEASYSAACESLRIP